MATVLAPVAVDVARILVADDDAIVRHLLVNGLRALGYEAHAVADGEQALAEAVRRRPDLAVLDVSMPGLDGLELTRRMREHADLRDLPVVLLTARTEPEDVAEGLGAGADDYLGKPFRVVELQARIEAALRRAATFARLAETARRDELTGLLNRRAWDEQLGQELARSARSGRSLSLALIDLDHFKRFNDTHGHQAGDRLLAEAAAGWRSALREGDVLARYGGEEFGLLLVDCELEDARVAVERVLARTPLGQSASAGVAQWNRVEVAGSLVARADAALYDAKERGRARVEVRRGPLVPV